MASYEINNEGTRLIHEASETKKRLELVKLKTDVLEKRQNGIIENMNSLRDSHKNLMDAVRALGDLVQIQQQEIQRLYKMAVVLGAGIILLGLAMIVR